MWRVFSTPRAADRGAPGRCGNGTNSDEDILYTRRIYGVTQQLERTENKNKDRGPDEQRAVQGKYHGWTWRVILYIGA